MTSFLVNLNVVWAFPHGYPINTKHLTLSNLIYLKSSHPFEISSTCCHSYFIFYFKTPPMSQFPRLESSEWSDSILPFSHISAWVLSLFHHVGLSDPMDCSPTGSSLSVGFSRQEYWSGFPFPPPGDLPDQRMNLQLLHGLADSLPLSHWEALSHINHMPSHINLNHFLPHSNSTLPSILNALITFHLWQPSIWYWLLPLIQSINFYKIQLGLCNLKW